MAYDESTVDRVREALSDRSDVVEKRIVGGGLGFMVSGHLCCGVSTRGLMVRVGADAAPEALAEPHVAPLMIGKHAASAFVVVAPEGYSRDDALIEWVGRGLKFIATLGER